MAKKLGGLMAELAELPNEGVGKKKSWWQKLESADPAFYADMMAVVKDYLAGSPEVCRKIPSDSKLAEWLIPKVKASGLVISPSGFGNLLRRLRSENQG
jgi:hypothetical protein